MLYAYDLPIYLSVYYCYYIFQIINNLITFSRSLFSPLMSLSTSLFGSSSYMGGTSDESLDFERLNYQFAQMKRNMNPYPLYNDRNMMFTFYWIPAPER